MNLKQTAIKIVKTAIVPLSLLALSLAIWFGGPLIAIAGVEPLSGVLLRASLIAIIWLIYLAVFGVKFVRRRKADDRCWSSGRD